MTILHSSEASTSKYAGFSLLVNNSGAVLCFFLEHTRWCKLLHVFFLKLGIHQGHNWVQGIFLVCTSRTAFGQICTLWVVFSLSFPFDCHIWRKILIESIHERIIIQPFSILFGGIGWFKQDEFAILPAVVPEGPIAILGLVCFPWHLLAFLSCDFHICDKSISSRLSNFSLCLSIRGACFASWMFLESCTRSCQIKTLGDLLKGRWYGSSDIVDCVAFTNTWGLGDWWNGKL